MLLGRPPGPRTPTDSRYQPAAGCGPAELADHPGAEDHTESGQTTQDLGVRVLLNLALELFGDLLELAGQNPDHPTRAVTAAP